MEVVKSKRCLKTQTDAYVYVSRENMLYQKNGDDYIPKIYFTTQEAIKILDFQTLNQVHEMCSKIGVYQKGKHKKIRITTEKLKLMINERLNSKRN